MLIQQIKAEASLAGHLCNECLENGVAIEIDQTIDPDNILIIKVDSYYNSLPTARPKSPDCLIIQRCIDGSFRCYIVELRNINSQTGFTVDEIQEKFMTCLDDFMSNRFGHYFHNIEIMISDIRLLFISDPYNFRKNPERLHKLRGHKLDALMSIRIPKYFNRHVFIDHKIPNPVVKSCG